MAHAAGFREAATVGWQPGQTRAMEVEGGLDATIIPYGEVAMAARKGFNVLADLSELMEESPEKVADRSFIANKRDNAKQFFQGVSESIYILRSQPELKGKIVPIIGKWLRIPTSLLRRHTTSITKSLLFLRAWGAKAYRRSGDHPTRTSAF
jgi:hypothetical protein